MKKKYIIWIVQGLNVVFFIKIIYSNYEFIKFDFYYSYEINLIIYIILFISIWILTLLHKKK